MIMTRRGIGFGLAAVYLMCAGASAGEKVPFSKAAFEATQKNGKPVVVEIAASWCPTCKVQAAIISELSALPKYKDLAVFVVDFDGQKEVVRSFKAQSQSTLIVFKGEKEVGRLVGDTNKTTIEAMLAKSL